MQPVSYFGLRLRRLIEDKNTRAYKIARAARQNPSVLSRIISGDQKTISPGVFNSIVQAATDSPTERAELLRAHLLDCCKGPSSDLIEIRIKDKSASDKTLPGDLEKAFKILQSQVAENPHAERMIIELSNMIASLQERRKKHD